MAGVTDKDDEMKVFTPIVLMTALFIPKVYSQDAHLAATRSHAAFEKLLSLEGTWKVKSSTADFRIIFEAISGNTVLLETWMVGSSKHSITVYHLDDDRVIATHYCPQGNQPRLELDSEWAAGQLDFTYFDATGMEDADEPHQHNLSFSLNETDGEITRSERYINSGVEETDSLTLERID